MGQKKENHMEIIKYFKLNQNKTQHIKICGTHPQQCLEGNLKLLATPPEVNSLSRERAEVHDLCSYFKKLGKEEQTKCKASNKLM